MKTVGVVLAGGRSTRFGMDKALYTIDGKPMYQYVLDTLKNTFSCDELVINTNESLKNSFHPITVVVDNEDYSDLGPLGGLYAVALKYPNTRLMVISCDTPFVSTEWMTHLNAVADNHPNTTVITTDAKRMHPTIGVFQHDTLAEHLMRQLDSGLLSIRSLFDTIPVKYENIEESNIPLTTIRNINRITDL